MSANYCSYPKGWKKIAWITNVCLLVCITLSSGAAFVTRNSNDPVTKYRSPKNALHADNTFKVSAETFDDLNSLSPEERTVVSVVRSCGPSVGYVTSVLPSNQARNTSRTVLNGVPSGFPLGSGSCFIVDTTFAGNATYLATNYHVIEQAYELQTMDESGRRIRNEITGNLTALLPKSNELCEFINTTVLSSLFQQSRATVIPEIYVRVNSATRFQKCRIVGVDPKFDLAVLCLEGNSSSDSFQALKFGSSTDLVVGQGLIAIGNPFGLESTVTTGVVSALGREVTTAPRRRGLVSVPSIPLRNCIQTDCAINPGNSGGPLLNRRGQVVGINSAILSTSGSSAGIGFAVPSDAIQEEIRNIIRQDSRRFSQRGMVTLGVAIVKQSAWSDKNWIAKIAPNSPAAIAGMKPLQINSTSGCIEAGEAIVAIGSKPVSNVPELQKELSRCVPGEQLSITLEDFMTQERRVVYLTL
ncbi:hypothetical protein FisN_13Lh320 [Fistulifera solaris]|uniref:Uncharacterized protein n=1 Tax=Fistulifera solaris TaxID=1519565 RepID=A0A1Z5KLD4_FISSO|nr:hypothetical protein FisN_13Lh320 [Fistulifera solaris]|eukprot:GAX27130.1 hypothetical protein FisN_13Lh320 [Fistulifera solaris]